MFVKEGERKSKIIINLKKELIFCMLTASWSYAYSYDPLTHSELTLAAYNKSVIETNPDFMSRLGLDKSSSQKLYTFKYNPPQNQSLLGVKETVRFGAEYEDDRFWATSAGTSSDLIPVAFFHFYDPQNNFPTGRSLTVLGKALGAPSPDWILETRGTSFLNQYYSYNKAQQQLLKAFTSSQPDARLNAFSMVFQSLGHIVHHIQDMAQPQHVRNEPHLPGSSNAAFEDDSKISLSPSFIQQLITAKNYPIPSTTSSPAFKKATDYWYSTASGYSGMAEFTSKNFVTYNTGYIYTKENGQWKIKPFSNEFPLPNGTNAVDGSAKLFDTSLTRTFNIRGVGPTTMSLNCIKGKVYDSFNTAGNATEVNQACEKLQSRFTQNYRYFDWDFPKEVWGDAYAILIPRAVSFSAGIINHFFRGQVNITSLGGGKWTLTNESPEATSGTYTVLSENTYGIRSQVAQFPLSLAAGSTSTISFNPPDDTVKVVVAFSGKLGDEDNMAHGRVVPFVKGDSSISLSTNPITISGGNSVSLNASVTGNSPTGTVQFFVDSVSKGGPVTLDANGKTSVNSGALAQGTHQITAVYSGDSLNKGKGGNPVNLIVTAPAVPCGTPIKAGGGSEGYNSVMDLGTISGRVNIEFEAYSIPDQIEITSRNGAKTKLVPASGMKSGFQTYSFNYDYTTLGDRFIDVKVIGNADTSTRWTAAVSCPGKAAQPLYPQVNVTFKWNPTQYCGVTCTTYQKCGYWNLKINNTINILNVSTNTVKLTPGVNVYVDAQLINGCWPSWPSGPGYITYTDSSGTYSLTSSRNGWITIR